MPGFMLTEAGIIAPGCACVLIGTEARGLQQTLAVTKQTLTVDW